MKQRVLITGADGQLGCSFRSLSDYGAGLNIELLFANRATLDICDPDAISRSLDRLRPDIVVNTAAYTAVDRAEKEAALAERINAGAPALLARACAERNCWLVHVSTDYVFDGASSTPYPEDAQERPLGVYGRTKLAGERAVVKALPAAVILRTSWVFSEFGRNFLKTMFKLGAQRDQLGIVADQTGSPTYAPHIAMAILRLIRSRAEGVAVSGGIYHFSGSPVSNWFEFASYIFDAIQQQDSRYPAPRVIPIETRDYPTEAVRPANSALAMGKLEALLPDLQREWRQGVQLAIGALLADGYD